MAGTDCVEHLCWTGLSTDLVYSRAVGRRRGEIIPANACSEALTAARSARACGFRQQFVTGDHVSCDLGITPLRLRSCRLKRLASDKETDMADYAHDYEGGARWGRHLRLATLVSGLLLGAGAIVNAPPAFAENGGDNRAGDGDFDRSGIYSAYSVQPGSAANIAAAPSTTNSGYVYLKGRKWLLPSGPSNRPIRGN
jgi:hypothetical protein